MRYEKRYLLLHHPTLAEYADAHLGLRKSSLSKYLCAYDWLKAKHPDWLEKTPEGNMPDLNDIADIHAGQAAVLGWHFRGWTLERDS